MNELRVEGVRCFREEQRIPIRRVTLLVGENSSGKSTVLAMVRAAWDIAFGVTEPDFNEQPFDLGGFDAIAHFRGGQGKRVHEFSVEGHYRVSVDSPRGSKKDVVRVAKGAFRERSGQPVLHRWEARQAGRNATVELINESKLKLTVANKGTLWIDEALGLTRRSGHLASDAFFAARTQTMGKSVERETAQKTLPLLDRHLFELMELMPGIGFASGPPRPFVGAPIRSKPERTYDPKKGTPEPEGSHVPMDMATLHATEPEVFRRLIDSIIEYGKAANLFSKVDVKRLGKKAGDPFQLLIAIDKFPFNVKDVGYGVSQILPILFDTVRAPAGQTFLLQQPEVHLHPRAQAALGTLLLRQAARHDQSFIVETHSDHLLDRVRMEVRDGTAGLKADDVVILYFDRIGGRAKVHPIYLNERGDLVGVPKTYRTFFLDEEKRLLGIGDE
jgi:hypothetical protein